MSLKNAKNKVSDLSNMPFNNNTVRKNEIGKRKKKITLSMCLPLPENLVSKNKTKKEVGSAKNSPCKNLRNHQALHSDTFNNSPSSSDDKLSDASSYIAISEAESCPSERVAPHTDDTLHNFIPSPNHNPSIVLPPKEIENVTFYGSACSPIHTLSNIELICDSNIKPLIESTRADSVLESSNTSSDVTTFDQIKLNRNGLAVSEDHSLTNCRELSNSCLSPKNSFLLLINKLNLTSDSREDCICNQLNCKPLIKPDGFNYDDDNPAFSIAVDVTMLKAVNDFIKENLPKSESFPNSMKDCWQDNLVKSSDLPHLPENGFDLNERDCNQFHTEDAESEISICSSTEIQPEFFDTLINLDAISMETYNILSSDCSMTVAANEVCGTASKSDQDDVLAGIGEQSIKTLSSFSNASSEKDILNAIIQESSMSTTNKTKKRKKRKMGWSTRKRRNCKKKQAKSILLESENIDQDLFCDTCDESEIDEPISDYISSKCLSNVDESNDLQVSNSQNNKNSSIQKYKNNEVDGNINVSDSQVNIAVENNPDKLVCSNNSIVESSKNNKHGGKNLKLLQENCQESIVSDKKFNSSAPIIKRKRNQVRNSSEIDINATLNSSNSENSINLKSDGEFCNTKPKKRKVDKNKNSNHNIKCSIPFKILSTDSNIDNQHSDNDIVYNTENKPKIKNKGIKSNSHKENTRISQAKLKNLEVPNSEMDVIGDKLSDNSNKKDPTNSSLSLEDDTKAPNSDINVTYNQGNTKTLCVKLNRLNKSVIDKLNGNNFCKEKCNNIGGIDPSIKVNSSVHELKKDSPLTSPVKNVIWDENSESLSTQALLSKSKSCDKASKTKKQNTTDKTKIRSSENIPENENNAQSVFHKVSEIPRNIGVSKSEVLLFKSKGTDKVSKTRKQNTTEKINIKSGENVHEVTSIVIKPCVKSASEDSSPNSSSSKSDSNEVSEISKKITKSSKKLKAAAKKNKCSEKEGCENLPVDKNSEIHLIRKDIPILPQDESNTEISSLPPPKGLQQEKISSLKDSESKNDIQSVFQKDREIPSHNKVSKARKQNTTKKMNVKSRENIHELPSSVIEPRAKSVSEDSSLPSKKLKTTVKKNKCSEKEESENVLDKNSEMHLRKDVPLLPQDESNIVKSKSLSPPKLPKRKNISASEDSGKKCNAPSPFQEEKEISNNTALPVSESSHASLFKSKSADKVSKAKKKNTTEKINLKSDENIHSVTSTAIQSHTKSTSKNSSSNSLSNKSDSNKISKSSKKLKVIAEKNKFSEKVVSENPAVDKNSEMHLRKDVSLLSQDESITVDSSHSSKSLSPPKLLQKNISGSEDSETKNNGQSVFQEEREIPSNIGISVVSEIPTESSNSLIASPSESCIKKMNKSTAVLENQNSEAVVIRIKNNVCSLVSETNERLSNNSKTVPIKTKKNKKALKVTKRQKEPLFVDNSSSLSTENSNISPHSLDNSSTTGNALSKSEKNSHLEEFGNSEFYVNPLENNNLFKLNEEVALSEITDTNELKNPIVNETQQPLILPLNQPENREVPIISNYEHEILNHEEKLMSKSSSWEKEKTDKSNGKETFLSDIAEQSNSTKVDVGNHLKSLVDFGNSLNQINSADTNLMEESHSKLSSPNETEIDSNKCTEQQDIIDQLLPPINDLSDEELDYEPEPDRLDELRSTNFVDNSADIDKSSAQCLSNINLGNPIGTFDAKADEFLSDEESESDEEDNFKRSRYHRNISADESLYSSKSNHENNFIQNEAPSSESPIQKSVEIISNLDLNAKDESNMLISEVQDAFHSDKASKSSSTKISRVQDVDMKIKEHCDQKQYHEAVEVAKTYITISSSSDVSKFILRKLLTTLFKSIYNQNKGHLPYNKILDNILELMKNKQNDYCLCDKKAASYFIAKCCMHPDLEIYAVKLYDFCHITHIPLNTEALSAFNSLLKTEDVSLKVLLHYFQYVKSVCSKTVSKDLTHIALEKSKTSKFSDVHGMCEFLYCITLKEIEKQDLKGFLQLCFKKGMWAYIGEMLIKWMAKESLMTCICDALFSDFEKMGNYFFKLAGAVYAQVDDFSPTLSNLFSQIGTTLMLNAVSMNRTKTALEILHVLHTYNANYSEAQSLLTEPSSKVDDSINIFPYSVVFDAIDICLNSKRPKDAFIIFQGFSWITPNENLNEAEKAYLFNKKCERLLKLIPLLNSDDSLNEGWEALKIFLSEAEQDSYQEKLNENKKEACLIYNKYLVHLLNSGKISSVQDLYQYSLGPKKDIFVVSSKLLRGLVITFSSHGMMEEASSVFTLGVLRKVYSIEKPETGSFPWDIFIMSDWTTVEIKLAVEWFIKSLFPLLADKPNETNFEKWFSVQISFKVSDPIKSKILCLIDIQSDSESCVQKTKNALQNMDPSLQFTEEPNKNTLCITSDSLYHYWKNKYSDVSLKFPSSDTNILHYHKRRISFGNEISIPTEDPHFATSPSEKSNKLENRQMKSPRDNISTSAETFVSEMIDEIRTNQQSDQYMPSSPESSPPKCYQQLLNNDKSSSTVLTEGNTSSTVGAKEVAVPSNQVFRAATHDNTSNITKTFINDTYSNISSGSQVTSNDSQMLNNKVPNSKSPRQNYTYSNVSSEHSPNFSSNQIINTKVSHSNYQKQNDTFDDRSCNPYTDFSNNLLTNSKISNSNSPKKNDTFDDKSCNPYTDFSNNRLTNSKISNSNSPKKNYILNNKSLQPSANLSNNQPINSKLSSIPKLTVIPQRIDKNSDVSNIQNIDVAQNASDKPLLVGLEQSFSTPKKKLSNKLKVIKSSLYKKTKKKLQKGDYRNLTISLSSNASIRKVSETSTTNSLVTNQKDTSNVEQNVMQEFVVKLPVSDVKIPAVPSVSPNKSKTTQSNSSRLSVNFSSSQISDQKQKTVIVSDKTSPITNLPKHLVVPGKTPISASPKQLTDVVQKKIIRLTIDRNNQVSDATQSSNMPVSKTALQTNAKSTPRTFNKLEINKNSTLNANVDFIHDKEKLKAVSQVSTVVNSSRCSRVRNIQGTGRKRRPSIIEFKKPIVKRMNIESKEDTIPAGPVCDKDIGNGFKKIIAYLKVIIAQKHKNLSSDEQDQKAHELALMFTNNNTKIEVLDKGSMKYLYSFANRSV